jgi:anti-sigma factor RsiW
MIDCPNGGVRDALPDYLHDRLATARRMEVEAHLAGCDACQAELSLLRDLRATMRHAPAIDVAAIAATIPPYRAPMRRGWSGNWRAAAAIAAIAVGGTSVALLQRASTGTGGAAHGGSVANVRGAASDSLSRVAVGPTEAPDRPAVGHAAVKQPAVKQPAVKQPAVVPQPARGGELAMTGGVLGDLSDGELSALLSDIESLDAVPSTDVESADPILPARDEALR